MIVEIKPNFILIYSNGVTKKYIGYSITEAKRLFKKEMRVNKQNRHYAYNR